MKGRSRHGRHNKLLTGLLILARLIQNASPFPPPKDWTICSTPSPELTSWKTSLLEGTCPLADDFSPWSQPPLCLDPANDSGYIGSDADCVFTLASFRGNQGISLITTPQLAASLVTSLDDSRVHPSLRSRILENSQHQESKRGYEVRDLPGRGKGMLATQKLHKHNVILVEFPVLIVRLDFINRDIFTERQKRAMLRKAVKQLPPGRRDAFMALARSTGGEPVLDVIRTNGFGIEIQGEQHLAIVINGSRINHNCRPNVFWRYSPSNMAMEVVTLRDIQAGEEVTYSYVPLGYTSEERQAVLQAWGFRCRCDLCSASRKEKEISDSRRVRLLYIHHTLRQASELNSRRIGELVSEALWLIDQEQLHPQLVEYYETFTRAYLDIGDFDMAWRFANLTDKTWMFYGGEEHENLEGMKKLREDILQRALVERDDD